MRGIGKIQADCSAEQQSLETRDEPIRSHWHANTGDLSSHMRRFRARSQRRQPAIRHISIDRQHRHDMKPAADSDIQHQPRTR
jgi:hypothetical protein